MNDQIQIVVRPTDDQASNQVLAVAAVLALEWAAPYTSITIGDHGEVVVDPKIEAIEGYCDSAQREPNAYALPDVTRFTETTPRFT